MRWAPWWRPDSRHLSSYAWLFIGGFALGIGAFLSALAFTRLPRRRMMAAAA